MNHSNTKPGYYLLMTPSKVFNLFFFLLSFAAISQNKIEGMVQSEKGENLSNVEVFNKTTGTKQFTDSKGKFIFDGISQSECELVFFKEKFLVIEKSLSSSDKNSIVILPKINQLNEVTINQQREKLFALSKLKDIEETAIYAGKKTEVISINKLTANKAINNTRQIFAQVVGLTINEGADGGLQLSIGARGLNPNRTSNFNTRQNDYDISADVLGYPESYYTTPTEALEEIQVVRGAASLQYGTQFGGLINFKIKSPSKKPFEFISRTTVGSFHLYTNYTSISGTNGKFSHYTFYNYKQGNGFRPNSMFDSKNFFTNLNYQFDTKNSLHFDFTHFNYLAQQPGGLTDVMFLENPRQSNRTRNWFAVDWNLFALRFKHEFQNRANFSLQLFGLDASRKTVGFRSNRVSEPDKEGTVRDIINGDFVNWGAEARYLKKYNFNGNTNAFLFGMKYYQSRNTGIQGPGSAKSDADFTLSTDQFPQYANQSNYTFPNLNVAFFGETIFKLSPNFSITPGFRFEKIKTQAEGSYRRIVKPNEIVLLDETIFENTTKDRNIILFGVGTSYKPNKTIELYGNVSQNYRSITFNDIRTVSPSQVIAENITDEKGYTSDLGIRGQIANKVSFDSSVFVQYYNDKIGEYETINPNGSAATVRLRDNIGTALTYGFETVIDWSINKTFFKNQPSFVWNLFTNAAFTKSKYLKSDAPNVQGNEVEFVPLLNLKAGSGLGYKNFMSSLQITYMSSQFTEAKNNKTNLKDNTFGIFGQIPAYYVADFSCSYKLNHWRLEASITNFTNNSYFTRRATGYPGPGILPSDSRTFYTTLEFMF
jgi:Fe(3+) dicitrate transport protein